MAQVFNRTPMTDEILKSDEAKVLYNGVSPVYGESFAQLWMFEARGRELDRVKALAEGLFTEFNPNTATWSLPLWEERYGIKPGADWSIERRREAVASKRRFNAPIIPPKISAMASALVGAQVDVYENTGKNKFTVYVRENVTLDKFRSAKEAIDEAKPAHLIYDIVIGGQYNPVVNNTVAVGVATNTLHYVEVS